MRRGLGHLISSIKTDNWVQEELDGFFAVGEPEGWIDPKTTISPSSSGGDCVREMGLALLGHRHQFAGDGLRRANNGTSAHIRWENYWRKIPSFMATEMRVECKCHGFRGTADVVLRHPATQRPSIGDVKTINMRGYNSLKPPGTHAENFELIRERYSGYLLQLQIYMHCLEQTLGETVNNGFLLFENKNDQGYKIYFVDKDFDFVLERAKVTLTAAELIRQGVLPEQPFDFESTRCRGCAKRIVCGMLQAGDPELTTIIEGRLSWTLGRQATTS